MKRQIFSMVNVHRTLVVCALLLAHASFAQDYASVIRDHINWIKSGTTNKRSVVYKLTRNTITDSRTTKWSGYGWVGYAEGSLRVAMEPGTGNEYLVSGNWTAFSDRGIDKANLAVQRQGFDFSNVDFEHLVLRPTGTSEIILNSWSAGHMRLENIRCFEDEMGTYISATSRGSITTVTLHKVEEPAGNFGTLVLNWIGAISNGEGDDPPHGPFGSIYALIYNEGTPCPGPASEYHDFLKKVHIKGPSLDTSKGKWEWLDGDQILVRNIELFKWRSKNDAVRIFIYESDPNPLGLDFVGREHDALFCEVIARSQSFSEDVFFTREARRERYYNADTDAIRNVIRRNPNWVKAVWNPPLSPATPTTPEMFIQIKTVF